MGNYLSSICPVGLSAKQGNQDLDKKGFQNLPPKELKQKIRAMKLNFLNAENKPSMRLSNRSKQPDYPGDSDKKNLREISEQSMQMSSSNAGTSSDSKKHANTNTPSDIEQKHLYVIHDSPEGFWGYNRHRQLRLLAKAARECERRLRAIDSMVANQQGANESSAISNLPITYAYSFLELIAEGHYGKIYKTISKHHTNRKQQQFFAVRVLQKTGTLRMPDSHEVLSNFIKNYGFMRLLEHPNIIRFYEAYDSETEMYLVEEYLDGSNLEHYFVANRGPFPEDVLRVFMFQMLSGVNHLHSKGIVHRDICPNNFLLVSDDELTVKLHDFGHSKLLSNSEATLSTKPPGLITYMAPEELLQTYGKQADLWSLGVCMYYFMTAQLPFGNTDPQDVALRILRGEFDKGAVSQRGYSEEAQHLVLSLLQWNPEDRPTAQKALNHKFFKVMREERRALGKLALTPEMLTNLRLNTLKPEFQREVSGLLVHGIDEREPSFVRALNAFMYIDKDFTGTLDADEIGDIYSSMGMPITREEVEEIIDSLYFREKSVVTYLEFIAATLDREFYRNKQRIRELFNYMDVDMSGEIDYKDIQDCFKRFGRLLDETKIRRMIAECDHNKDQKISFDEFYQIVNAEPKRQHLSLSNLSQLSTGQLRAT